MDKNQIGQNNQQQLPQQQCQVNPNQQLLQQQLEPGLSNSGIIQSTSSTSSYFQPQMQQQPVYIQIPFQGQLFQQQPQYIPQHQIGYGQPQIICPQNNNFFQQQFIPSGQQYIQQHLLPQPVQQAQMQPMVLQQNMTPQPVETPQPIQNTTEEQQNDDQKVEKKAKKVKKREDDRKEYLSQEDRKRKKIKTNKQFSLDFITTEIKEWIKNSRAVDHLDDEYFKCHINDEDFDFIIENCFQLKEEDNPIPWKMTFQDENTKTAPTYNKPKILMKKFIQVLSNYNLGKLNLIPTMKKEILKLSQNCENSGTYKNGKNIVIRDAYTHAHFHVIFCRLNTSTIQSFKKSKSKDREYHETFFSVKLDEISQGQIEKINFVKDMIFNIIRLHIFDVDTNSEYPSQINQEESGQKDFEDFKDFKDYQYKVFYNIKQMHDGHIITKF